MSEVIHSPFGCGDILLEPKDIARLADGLEAALTDLGIKDRNDPMTNSVAKLIIQLAKDGERGRAVEIVRNSS
jgi:hypothetical protein